MDKENREKHHTWCKEIRAKLPEFATRVFALRGKIYNGYGTHYALEKLLGTVIRGVNSSDERLTFDAVILLEICVEELIEKIEAAEKSAEEFASKEA